MNTISPIKLRYLFLLSLFFLFTLLNPSILKAQNILKNPGFEEVMDSKPSHWELDAWNKDVKTFRFGFDERHPHSGKRAIVIDATEPNDLKIMQKVSVKPESTYKFSCWVKASNIPKGNKGANLSALNILDTSESLYDTGGEYRELVFYGRTLKGQDEVVFTLRLGGYGSLNKGIASFDDCKVELVDNVPNGVNITKLLREGDKKTTSLNESSRGLLATSFSLLLFVGLMFLCLKYLVQGRYDFMERNEKTLLTIIILSSTLFKITLSYLTTGFPVDLITYKAWSELLVKKGLAEFYYSGHFVDYPPLYMYVFYLVGLIRNLFGISYDSQVFVLLLKIPSIIAEVLSLLLIYKIGKDRELNIGSLYMILILFSLNPVLIINTCLWGQVDSFLTLFVCVALILLYQDKFILSSVVFTVSILIKPQALMYTPVFLLYAYYLKDYKQIIKAVALSIITVFLVITPFSLNHGFYWIIKIFKNAFTQYPFATLNAFNIHALFANNWAPVMNKWFFFSFKTWGTVFIVIITIASAILYVKSRNTHKILLISLFIVLSVFMLSTEMHERYMVPAFLLFCIVYTMTKRDSILYLFVGFTITNTFNLSYTLMLAHHGIYHLNPNDILMRAFSLINLILYVLTVREIVSVVFINPEEIKPDSPLNKDPIKPIVFNLNTSITIIDIVAITVLSTAFISLLLFNLGDKKSPQTYWQPSAKGEGFFVDFQREQDLSEMMYFYGLSKGGFRIDVSNDFVHWQSVANVTTKGVFMWKSIKLDVKARYVSIITEEPQITLYELGFYDKSGNLIKNVFPSSFVVMKETKGSFYNLFDEQGLVPQRPSYLNSMYFDEIYFARTAYEHIHGIEPYENTHPPLGKLIIAVGIKLFGMTPFGWRLMGVVFGMFLLILMYLMGKLLFGHSKFGIFTALLIGFDFMPFVQSRIATVDIMAVTFIVAMFYFMIRFYASSDDSAVKYLALSGLFFALGASTKWLCLYSGVGLAIIYFYKLYRELRSERTVFLRYIVYGSVFFVLIPLIIYFMTFIPFMLLPGEGHDFVSVLKLQEHMYQYHKTAKGSHPFSSTWWQWPLIVKPMWFYMGENLPPTKAESIVSMGNPLIWWFGSICMIYLLYRCLIKRQADVVGFFLLIAFATNYVPWMLVPRETYIYHFFASVPFLILSIVYSLQTIKINKVSSGYLIIAYITLAGCLFLLFYPILSGMTIDKSYMAQYLRWFDSWIFFVP